jgi:thiamine pyrophosphate-dependent acetolactate synthase large subunit-like protein
VAIVGDGGFAMLMAEMTTAVQHNLPVKVIVLKNNSLAEVKFEQIELGNPSFGCDLSPIDFVAFARACGAEGYRCERPEEVRPAIRAALSSPRPALVEAIADPAEKRSDPDQSRARMSGLAWQGQRSRRLGRFDNDSRWLRRRALAFNRKLKAKPAFLSSKPQRSGLAT